MADDRGRLTSIAWQEIFPWINLVRAMRLAIDPRALLLAALAMVGTVAGWRICGEVCTQTFLGADVEQLDQPLAGLPVSPEAQAVGHFRATLADLGRWPWEQPPPFFGAQAQSPSMAPYLLWPDNPLTRASGRLSAPFVRLFDLDASWPEFVYLLLCAVWELVVWAFFGGAITRLAAVALAREEQLSWGQLTDYARSKWISYFAAPLFPLFGVLLATIPLALFGLLLRSDFTLVIAGVLWLLVLAGGFVMAILLVGLFFGWPLMWATISTEGTDSFDALSRSYAYTFQRPLHYFFYTTVAALLGIFGWFVVAFFASATIGLGAWGVSWLDGSHAVPRMIAGDGWGGLLSNGPDVEGTGPTLIRLWVDAALTLAMAYVFSYFWTASTAIYFLLRGDVDNTELDEVYVPEEAELRGLPPLQADAAGVPGVADMPPSGTG